MARDDVLIVGAGPTGLVLALWLTKLGVVVRIIDQTIAPGTTSRALGVQARTLELYRQLDLDQAVVAAGHKNNGINLWVKGKRRAHLSFGSAGADLTPYPFMLIYPQDQHEKLLVDKLETMGVIVERQTEFVSFEDKGDRVFARLRKGATEEVCEVRYLAGCDGARSPIRHQIGAVFPGGTYDKIFYVADVVATGPAVGGEIHLSVERSDFVGIFSYGDHGESRLIGAIDDDHGDRAGTLTFDDVSRAAIESLGLKIISVGWFSTYHVHHRVTDHYRRGRTFLLGDAAHVHSPAGAQGMNTGIGDAINLAWKLSAVLKGRAPDSLLDSYQTERRAFAEKLVETTDRIFTYVTADNSFAEFFRTRLAPIFVPVASNIGAFRKFLFRTISQTMINYRDCTLNDGRAGQVSGGDRLPWVRIGDSDNFASLSAISWQVHVYGKVKEDLADWCRTNGVTLTVYPWSDAFGKVGLAEDAAYLMRPDSYVGCADPSGHANALEKYMSSRSLHI